MSGVRAEGSLSTTDALLPSLAMRFAAGDAIASAGRFFFMPGSSAGVGGCEAFNLIFGRPVGVAVAGASDGTGCGNLRESRGAMMG